MGAGAQVGREELLDDEDYEDLLDDIACEVEAKFGALAAWAPQVRRWARARAPRARPALRGRRARCVQRGAAARRVRAPHCESFEGSLRGQGAGGAQRRACRASLNGRSWAGAAAARPASREQACVSQRHDLCCATRIEVARAHDEPRPCPRSAFGSAARARQVVAPRPPAGGAAPDPPGVGLVFLAFDAPASAVRAPGRLPTPCALLARRHKAILLTSRKPCGRVPAVGEHMHRKAFVCVVGCGGPSRAGRSKAASGAAPAPLLRRDAARARACQAPLPALTAALVPGAAEQGAPGPARAALLQGQGPCQLLQRGALSRPRLPVSTQRRRARWRTTHGGVPQDYCDCGRAGPATGRGTSRAQGRLLRRTRHCTARLCI